MQKCSSSPDRSGVKVFAADSRDHLPSQKKRVSYSTRTVTTVLPVIMGQHHVTVVSGVAQPGICWFLLSSFVQLVLPTGSSCANSANCLPALVLKHRTEPASAWKETLRSEDESVGAGCRQMFS